MKFEKNNFAHKLTEDFYFNMFYMKDNSRIFRLVKKSNLLERIIKGYNLVQKLESEKNYRCQYAPYLLTLAQKVNSFEIPELNELRLSTPGWDSVVEIVEKTNKLLKDYQNASTFTWPKK